MSKLIIVSARLPFEIVGNGTDRDIKNRAGGISPGLNAFYRYLSCSWVGWDGNENISISEKQKSIIDKKFKQQKCFPVELDADEISNYYYGFCNRTIWPLFHYFAQLSELNTDFWDYYCQVNGKFAGKVLEIAEDGDKIWVHDFHLMLVPRMVREVNPNLSIGFFMHIPFPSYEIFRILPWRRELVEGMLGADLVGFHSFDYERHFMSSVRRLLGYDNILNTVRLEERVVKIDNFPMGINFESVRQEALDCIKNSGSGGLLNLSGAGAGSGSGSGSGAVSGQEAGAGAGAGSGAVSGQEAGAGAGAGSGAVSGQGPGSVSSLVSGPRTRKKGHKIILSIDRLDYAKGIPSRLEAFETFLRENPRYIEKVSLVLCVIPSREVVAEYKRQRKMIDELAGRINGEFGTMNWVPVLYFYRPVSRQETIELYTISDIALVTPLRDGMNLMAKEYMAARTDGTGVLILSEMTGAAKEMSESILVNPHNKAEIVEAIKKAVDMTTGEQKDINQLIQKRLQIYNEEKWANDIITSLENVKKLQETNLTRKVSADVTEIFTTIYNNSGRRIIFLDYDGTLTGFHNDPQKARPDDELYEIMRSLTGDERNHVVIISGRDKETLGKWFGEFTGITFIAEHGVWVKEQGKNWSMLDKIDRAWMESIRPVINFYVDRTPRSLLEEKNYSLVWHYRHADPDLGAIRSWELKDDLRELVTNLNLEIMDGDKVIEVKNSGINKGRAAALQLARKDYDFIIAIGDDWTDEYTFGAMPEKAITIKVGTKPTRARYYTDSVETVRSLLKALTDKADIVKG
jgi:trehalose-phosphatase